MGDVSAEDALAELAAARNALRDARVLLAGDGSDAGVYNRLYYAAFEEARASSSQRGGHVSRGSTPRKQSCTTGA